MLSRVEFRRLSLGFAIGAAVLAGCGDNGGGGAKVETSGSPTPSAGSGESGAKRPTPTAPTVEAKGDTIKIGIVASVSGDNKPWGEDSLEGAKMAVEEFNKAGGLNGKQVELKLEDSGSKQDQAKTAADKLLSDGCIALVGETSSGNTIQMAKAAFEKNVPVIAVGATRTDLTDIGSHVFRVCYTDDFQGPVMAKFAYDGLGLRKIAIVTDNNLPYSQGLSKSFKDMFVKLGGTVVKESAYQSGGTQAPQYTGLLTEIKSANPDGIFCSGYFTEVGPLAQQARSLGIESKVKLLGGDGWDSEKLLESGGDAIVGGFFCNHYTSNDTRPQVVDFIGKWKAKHDGKAPETTMGALGYDATALTLDALKRAGKADSKSLIDALDATEKFAAVSGDVTLKGNKGNPPKRAIVVEVTKKGPDGWQKFAKAYTPDQLK